MTWNITALILWTPKKTVMVYYIYKKICSKKFDVYIVYFVFGGFVVGVISYCRAVTFKEMQLLFM